MPLQSPSSINIKNQAYGLNSWELVRTALVVVGSSGTLFGQVDIMGLLLSLLFAKLLFAFSSERHTTHAEGISVLLHKVPSAVL